MRLYRIVFIVSLAFLVNGFCFFPGSSLAFDFTVTADCREEKANLATVLDAITANVGTPAFHVSAGDIDRTVPETRDEFTSQFGADFIWYPIVGNHEAEYSPGNGYDDIEWIREEYTSGHDGRTALRTFTNEDGPSTCLETTYTWEYENAFFIALNEYWDGTSDVALSDEGQIIDALNVWLEDRLAANTQPFIFVFGHEPAFPQNRHTNDSLNDNETTRDAFWQLLDDYGVQAYFCGHTHVYSKYQEPGFDVLQFDVGNSGNDSTDCSDCPDGQTFVHVEVNSDSAVIKVYRNNSGTTWSEYTTDRTTVLPAESDPSCPYLYGWNGEDYVLSGPIFEGVHCPDQEYLQDLFIVNDLALEEDALAFKVIEVDDETSYINSVEFFYRESLGGTGQWAEVELISATLNSYSDVSAMISEKDDDRLEIVPGDEIMLRYQPPVTALSDIQFKCVSSGYYLWSSKTRCQILQLSSPATVSAENDLVLSARLNNMSTETLPDNALARFDIIDQAGEVSTAGYVSVAGLPPGDPRWYSLKVAGPTDTDTETVNYTVSIWVNDTDITFTEQDE